MCQVIFYRGVSGLKFYHNFLIIAKCPAQLINTDLMTQYLLNKIMKFLEEWCLLGCYAVWLL
jgi:hypothetical protein